MIAAAAPRPARRNPLDLRRRAAWLGSCSPARAVSARVPPSVLLLARPGDAEELVDDLSRREDLCLLRVATAAAANVALREMPVALVVACPEIPPATIDSVLAHLDEVRPGTPVLAVRTRQAEEPAAWRERGVGVLRMPLLPGVLSRSVDVVLDMRRKLQKGNG